MDIEHRLRQLNKIQPNPIYARSSRARILTVQPKFTWRTFVMGVLQSGGAMALTGVLLFFAVGGFSLWRLLSPVTGLDHRSLSAEAEAIDIQIHLADLQYQDSANFGRQALVTAQPSVRSTAKPNGAGAASEMRAAAVAETTAASSTASADGSATSTASTTPQLDVDQVLDILSK